VIPYYNKNPLLSGTGIATDDVWISSKISHSMSEEDRDMVLDMEHFRKELLEMRKLLESVPLLFNEQGEATNEKISEHQAQIADALERIQKGGYGICTECGCPIEEGRLELNPEAQGCAKCQEQKR
jgi:hypothetical protein